MREMREMRERHGKIEGEWNRETERKRERERKR